MKKLRLSVDDGCVWDVKVAELARKYDLECTFYWPVEWRSLAYDNGYEPLTFDQAEFIAADFEIGSHTITHRHLTKIPESEARIEIEESKYMLEKLFDKPITKFCPPRGYTNDRLTAFTERFYSKQRLTKGEDLVHVHPNSGANDNKPWIESITVDTEELWMHSWELTKYNLWEEFEGWLERSYS